ncbi:hypothetical protein [Natrarchaeobaculum aegyptiacum]|uniref:Uncharacterized protein n=1 Tax=Natrarchaeobaculum aegyptiacum TaxID=745377 RepID=A0A2Z2HTG3_9EURY|nr:hypothetical protein [Natrarchaeobaculum aegyptiacum]ARS90490.1 hypothetical protein B1756_12640 [Natrarchaeobaculum aegyptiacum]
MSDKKFTFVELHLEGAQFGPSTISDALPFGDAGPALEGEAETETESAIEETSGDLEGDDESGSKGKAAIGAIVALAFLVGIGVAVKKFRGGDEEEADALEEEPEVIVN